MNCKKGLDNILYVKRGQKYDSLVIAVANNKAIYVPLFNVKYGNMWTRIEGGHVNYYPVIEVELTSKYFKTYNSTSRKFDELYFGENDVDFNYFVKLEEDQATCEYRFKQHSMFKFFEENHIPHFGS